ncbi:Predicted arabinose efflux permease, MFS family [Micromonospora pallida]|uniref:Predicted arabinose efflux permease, MFS family n=1 Tax=Micromonospora pallida TaxID=145854 RepID=A0A1C6SDE1_9ACTN|nr:MFS transporter [Micromonospora pallida]SCL27505.1 Predicted arabinose efflux permease, MFS family [Micromonospora pallida]
MATVTRSRLLRDVPPAARKLLAGQALSALGDGVFMPLLLIYLYRVEGLSLPKASLVVAIAPMTTFLLTLPAGALIDRIGARRALRFAAVGQALGVALLAGVSTLPLYVLAIVIKSAAEAAFWPASSSLLARLAVQNRERAFALRFLAVNAGIGIGGLVAALAADISRPLTFQLLIFADALSFLLLWWFVPTESTGGTTAETETTDEKTTGTYRMLLADRRFVLLMAAMAVLMAVGYGQLDAGIPAFTIDAAGLDESSVGLLFTANTVVVVIVQLAVLRRLGNSDAPKALAAVAVAWAVSWVVLGIALVDGITGTMWALVVVIGSQVVFAAAETILQPVHSALINDMAPDELRGRYNAASALAWNAGFFAGPVLSGVLLGAATPVWYLVLMVGGCLASGAFIFTLRGGLTAARARAGSSEESHQLR